MMRSWRRLAVFCGLCAWLAAGFAPAQVAEQSIWPRPDSGIWFWVLPSTDLAPAQVDAAFQKAIGQEMAFLDPGFAATVFLARHIRLTKGKGAKRKKYGERPEKADDLRIETEWRNGYLNQNRGSSYCFIALDAIRSLDLHYLPDPRPRFPKAPEGRNWNVNLLAGSLYNFFFASEDAARDFINAVASLLKQRGMDLTFSRFGLMWENVIPAQAAEMGRPVGAGILVTGVAVAGPADRAGVRPLDSVLEVNGAQVKNFSQFSLLLEGVPAGAKTALLLLRCLKDPRQYPEPHAWEPLKVEMEDR